MSAEPKRLTSDGRLKSDPVFVKDGEEVVFTVLESPTQTCLMRLKLADGSVERFNPGATSSEFEPAFSADNRYCAFVHSRGNLNLTLIIRDTKLKKDATFDPGGGFAGMRHPTLAPDGSRVVFSMANVAGAQLISVDNQGKDRKDLTRTALNQWPAFSPDGKQIAFSSSRDGDFEIYVMDADGGNVRRLTKSPGLDARPAWSPDGKRLAFTSNRSGHYEVILMDADGANPRRLDTGAERDDHAAWHPDGKQLLLVSERRGRSDLSLVAVPE
jgi:Tol biopolymer transport system component